MLLEFSVANFRSFYSKRTFTLQGSTSISDIPENISKTMGYNVLRTAAIYGANSSGKTNFVRALASMGNIITESAKLNYNEELDPYDPFLLMKNTEKEPTYYEIIFIENNIRYRYGFEHNLQRIVGEWLFIKKGRKKEEVLFIRNEEGIGISENDFKEGIDLEEKTNDNRLFISVVAQLGGTISKLIVEWFSTKCNAISGIHSKSYMGYSKEMFHTKLNGHNEALNFLQNLKLGFESLSTIENEFDPSTLPTELSEKLKKELTKQLANKKVVELLSIHKKYDKNGVVIGEIPFDVYEKESEGTQKLIDLSGLIFDTLINGDTLFIDELDCRMHPIISEFIVKLFNDKETNPNNAQLIFTTHDTHLLSSKIFRRDQIWFAEKDSMQQTDLYTLNDIILPNGQKPRNDSNYEKNYIAGRYGAIPFLMNYNL